MDTLKKIDLSDYAVIKVSYIRHTLKATLVWVHDPMGTNKPKKVWIPKSQIGLEPDWNIVPENQITNMAVSNWIFKTAELGNFK